MAQYTAKYANISPSKRSFDESAFPPIFSTPAHHCLHYAIAQREQNHSPVPCSQPYSAPKRRLSSSRTATMLAEHNSIMSGSFPSFMSVFGSEDAEVYRPIALDSNIKTNQDEELLVTARPHNEQTTQLHLRPQQHHYRGSDASLFSESTESSPTTTNSTFDSPLISDNSASASPESANSIQPPNPFSSRMMQDVPSTSVQHNKPQQANPRPLDLTSDGTKNPKKLTLNMDLPAMSRPITAPEPLDASQHLSAPTSPLKEPMRSARKKRTNLTIRTPGYNQMTFPRALNSGIIPPTPNSRPALHQYQSSPSISSLASPRAGPPGGMTLALPSLNTSGGISSSNRNSFLANSMPDLREEEGQIPKSQEAPEKGYTEGPVCIYDDGVYLYLEPTAEEARQFDSIINVAKEIRNPFKDQKPEESTVMSVWRDQSSNPARRSMTEPQTAVSEFSFKSAWEFQPIQNTSTITPTTTTPTQTSFSRQQEEPEYIHVRWDHNSEILEDLYPLCKIIDDRIAQHKKVLIHCQLGVSRSASLIIAYGLYKNYQPNFHSMYSSVKERSRWVGPNMSLIYQLTDFKTRLNKNHYLDGGRAANSAWFTRSPDGPLTPAEKSEPAITESSSKLASENPVPQLSRSGSRNFSKPFRLNKTLPPVPLFPKDGQPQPSGSGPPTPAKTPPTSTSTGTVKRAASRPLPFRERASEFGQTMTIPEHKPRILPKLATPRPPSAIMDLAMQDVPSTPSLFSPRATEFMATPFGIRGAGDLETPGNRMSKEIPAGFNWLPLRKEHQRTASKDPRAPLQYEAGGGFANIDGYL